MFKFQLLKIEIYIFLEFSSQVESQVQSPSVQNMGQQYNEASYREVCTQGAGMQVWVQNIL